MSEVLFYVSGHGYGHATRTAEIIRCLAVLRPDWKIHVVTAAPPDLFQGLAGFGLSLRWGAIDSGVVESADSLHVDQEGSLRSLKAVLRERERIIATEAAFIKREQIALIVADIPYMAGDIAEAAGVPCLAVGNFTWDWIYEPYLGSSAHAMRLLDQVRSGYAKMKAYLRLPFNHAAKVFKEVVDVPLVARQSQRNRTDILQRLSFSPETAGRPLVLLGMRGAGWCSALVAAAWCLQDVEFLCLEPSSGSAPANVHHVALGPDLAFPDLMRACDVVVAKLGYSIVSEAIANKTALLYPPRTGFREDELLRAQALPYIRSKEISLGDFHAGDWGPQLQELLAIPVPAQHLETDGAKVCANIIVGRYHETRLG